MIAVTGSNGDLGIRLLKALKARGLTRLRALVRSETSLDRVRSALGSSLDIVKVDYRDPDSLRKSMLGCAVIINLVGTIRGSKRTPYRIANENVVESLLQASRSLEDPYIIQVSIVGADTESRNQCLVSRGQSDKKLLEGWGKSLVLRAPMILFPGGASAIALSRRASSWGFWLGNGSTWEQPLDDRDLFTAIELAIKGPTTLRGGYDLVGPERVRYSELVTRASQILRTKPRPINIPSSWIRLATHIGNTLLRDPPITKDMLDIFLYNGHHDPKPLCNSLGLELRSLNSTLQYSLLEEETLCL